MISRRKLLKSSVAGCGAAGVSGVFGPLFARAVFAGGATAGPIVRTRLGRLRGAYANGIYSFKGIHYGASTAGAMRFRPALPPQPWTGVRDALEVGPPPPQDRAWAESMPDLAKFLGDLVGPGTMGEDCLVLNLWTPGLRSPGKRPVMIWLPANGSSGISLYDGTNLAKKHDVVVVGINHRVSVFGHLYLGKIGGEKYADSGNVGMLDIVLALRWVRANIARFGGDPGNVTIFGESAGGQKINVLMAMPSATGLFHRAIVESGSAVRGDSIGRADTEARRFLAQIHVAPDRVDDLLKIPMDQLIAALHTNAISLGPVVDGRSLLRRPFDPDPPVEAAKVPMLIGTNADEATNTSGLVDPRLFSLHEAVMRSRLKNDLHLTDESKLDALIGTYRKTRPNATPSDIYFAVATDRWWRMDAIAQAERKAAPGSTPVYMYLFAWPLPIMGGKLKATHCAEVPFVFDNLDKIPQWFEKGAGLQPLADKVSAAWAAFARAGNPNHAGLPHWPAYDASTRATMVFNSECRVVNDPGKEERLAMMSLSRQ